MKSVVGRYRTINVLGYDAVVHAARWTVAH